MNAAQHTPGPCGCTIIGPLGIGALLSETHESRVVDGKVYQIRQCARCAAAPELLAALMDLVARCDGEEGVRADGSNIQTMRAHAAIAKARP